MKVLILGGTGAMGTPLQKHLLNLGYEVHVTSRSKHENGDVLFHCGDAHDTGFLEELLNESFDVIVDFMSYKTDEFATRASILCSNTEQYIFISSSRVYSKCEGMITEEHPRILDVCDDQDYLKTDEYALTKARQEDILRKSEYKNWTIVRPSLTYNSERLQYAIGEKEEWLYRYLHNEKIVFPRNMSDVITTMSYGDDVAYAIAMLVGNEKALGEAVHIAGARPVTWEDVNRIYSDVLEEKCGRTPEYVYVDDWKRLSRDLGRYYQIKYARSISRRFDNTKLENLIGRINFTDSEEGLKACLSQFLEGKREFRKVSWKAEAYYNKITKDRLCVSEFGSKDRIKYLIGRYTPYFKMSGIKE